MGNEDEVRADETLTKITIAAFENGLKVGFTIGKGRPPRPEEIKALKAVSDKSRENLQETFQKG